MRYPPTIKILLMLSLFMTMGRAASLPFITVYLAKTFHFLPDSIGVILSASFFIGIISNLYSGYLVDKLSPTRLVCGTILFFIIGFILFPIMGNMISFIIVLAIIQATYTTLNIAIKAYCANQVDNIQRIKVFSLNYTCNNIGWAFGPTLGTLVTSISFHAPFLLSAGIALICLLLFLIWSYKYPINPQPITSSTTSHSPATSPLNFKQTISILKKDKRLLLFTIGTTLVSVITGQFSGYLSQYLVAVSDPEFTYKVIGSIMTVNAIVVITLQYFLSSKMTQQHLMRWLVIGTLFYSFGLIGFMSTLSLPVWCVSMVIFTLGEVTVVPSQYLFIDFIAPAHLKGSYYGVQSLGNLGGAINPILCGLCLTYFIPSSMFVVLVIVLLSSLYFFHKGVRS